MSQGCALIVGLLVALGAEGQTTMQEHWQVVQSGDSWQLQRDGEPFFIQGAVTGSPRYVPMLAQAGANAMRAPARPVNLDVAAEQGLKVLVKLPVRGERNGIDWDNDAQVAEQAAEVMAFVEAHKGHPAVMMWEIGNELDHSPGKPGYNPRLWSRLNELAIAIHAADPHHPVCTVVGSGHYDTKVKEIARDCAALDVLGVNAYGDIAKVAEQTRQHWPKPYFFGEWGPTGHWQVPKTTWRVPLEQTSSATAAVTAQRYQDVILADPAHCIGSFVFYWDEKQETTHTWYGLFRDGRATETIDVMTHFWTGDWPANRAPFVRSLSIDGAPDRRNIRFAPGVEATAQVEAEDPDGDPLTIVWDVRAEVVIPAGSYAGGGEQRAEPIDGLILSTDGLTVRFRTPSEPGPYRLFVELTDGQGHAGYANLPLLVEAAG